MINTIEILQKQDLLGHEFTIYGTKEEPLFLAKEVADMIDYSKTTKGSRDVNKMLQRLDDDDKCIRRVSVTWDTKNNTYLSTARQTQDMLFITEDGLYELLMRSTKPIAKQFKKGVKEILKEIRKTGGYIASFDNEDEAAIMARAHEIALRSLERHEERIKELQAQAEEQNKKTQTLLQQNFEKSEIIEEQRPKVEYYDEVLQSHSLLTTSQIANVIGMTAPMLNKKLKELGIQYKQSKQWLLCMPYNTWGLHATRTHVFNGKGDILTNQYTCWTERGKRFILALHDCEWDIAVSSKTIIEVK